MNLAEKLTNGRKMACQYKAKVVGFILGNIPNCCWSSYEYGKKGLLILVKRLILIYLLKTRDMILMKMRPIIMEINYTYWKII